MAKRSKRRNPPGGKGIIRGRRFAKMPKSDWLCRFRLFMNALNPEGIRALGEMATKIMVAIVSLCIVSYGLIGAPSKDFIRAGFIWSLLLLQSLGRTPRRAEVRR
jgi:hypothetical protein